MKSTSDSFRFRRPVAVRFRDVDIGGHAHHSQTLIYMEEARAAYWRDVAGHPGLDDVDYIMAEAHVRWKSRVLYPDTLDVAVRVSALGKKHFVMDYEVHSGDGRLLASATTTQVMYDYGKMETKRMPERTRAAIEAYDGPFEQRPIG